MTSFFRDLETFEALKTHVYPAIVNEKGNSGSIRMWAPGCSTGEETYSLAMTSVFENGSVPGETGCWPLVHRNG